MTHEHLFSWPACGAAAATTCKVSHLKRALTCAGSEIAAAPGRPPSAPKASDAQSRIFDMKDPRCAGAPLRCMGGCWLAKNTEAKLLSAILCAASLALARAQGLLSSASANILLGRVCLCMSVS